MCGPFSTTAKSKRPEQQEISYWTLIVTNLSQRTSCFTKKLLASLPKLLCIETMEKEKKKSRTTILRPRRSLLTSLLEGKPSPGLDPMRQKVVSILTATASLTKGLLKCQISI